MKKIILIGLCMILLSSLVSSEQIGYKIIYTDQSMDVNQLFDSLKGEFETISVATCDHTDIEARLDALEAMLNITIEPDLTPLYTCSYRGDEECPGGLSTPNKDLLSTRCYNPFKIGWKTCSTGWVLT